MLIKSKDEVGNTIKQISEFQNGNILPLKTGIEHLDMHLLGGLTPSIKVGICAMSGFGKTHFLEDLLTGLSKHNDMSDVVFLQCNWEIPQFKQILRDLSRSTGKSVKDVLFSPPSKEDITIYSEVTAKYKADNLYIQKRPSTPLEFYNDAMELVEKYKESKIIISIDNLENVLVESGNQQAEMVKVLSYINQISMAHSHVSFLILNQMNRSLAQRTEPMQQFPQEQDIFGTGAFFKLCDVILGIHMPFKLGLKEYGVFSTNRYKYIDDSFKKKGTGKNSKFKAGGNIFYHYLKSRDIALEYDIQDLFVEKIFDVPEDKEEEKITEFDY